MRSRTLRRSAGFSLVEVLVAAFFMLVLLLSIIPVFTRSTISNQMAYDNTRAAAFAREEMEQYFQAPFFDEATAPTTRMNIPGGQNERVVKEYFDIPSKAWVAYTGDDPPAGTRYQWTRKVTIKQFHISAIDGGKLVDSQKLNGGADPSNVHLKQILIEIQRGGTSSILGPPRKITLNLMRGS